MKFTDGVTPTFDNVTVTQVSSSPNVWDLTYENSDWNGLYALDATIIEVIDANITGVTSINGIFNYCDQLTSVQLFDTSTVTNMAYAFQMCTALTSIPLFDTSNVTNMNHTFYGCDNVQTGALALYQQASTNNPQPNHEETFTNCGINTATGVAELAQIPSDWGGTAS
jgi:surface protein